MKGTSQAVTVQDPQGETTYLLGHDQVGSLKAAAAMEGKGAACATALPAWSASATAITIPRWAATAPDPLGDTGGDHDLYDEAGRKD